MYMFVNSANEPTKWQAIIKHPSLANLKVLSLNKNNINDDSIDVLFQAQLINLI